jgi:hypothetical protein
MPILTPDAFGVDSNGRLSMTLLLSLVDFNTLKKTPAAMQPPH